MHALRANTASAPLMYELQAQLSAECPSAERLRAECSSPVRSRAECSSSSEPLDGLQPESSCPRVGSTCRRAMGTLGSQMVDHAVERGQLGGAECPAHERARQEVDSTYHSARRVSAPVCASAGLPVALQPPVPQMPPAAEIHADRACSSCGQGTSPVPHGGSATSGRLACSIRMAQALSAAQIRDQAVRGAQGAAVAMAQQGVQTD